MRHPGAHLNGNTAVFTVWAPMQTQMAVHLYTPEDRVVQMQPADDGYWEATVENTCSGALYKYRIGEDALERPDPASHAQPEGVHGASMIVDHHRFSWNDQTTGGIPLDDYIIYELHIGTFTDEGTFAAAAERLSRLVELGITVVEIMPVAQFPGERNWGYDGVYPFAAQHSYGGANGLKFFVNECHRRGLAVILDVVYNHLGPEGNYLRDFGPYFTSRYSTPWGESLNFDGEYSDGVVDFFIANACYWLRYFHIDALRLDAVHAICDFGARPFLQRLSQRVEAEFGNSGHPRFLIAESDLNDVRILHGRSQGGLGLDAQWSDDFHHAAHALLTGEQRGYYTDFGDVDHLCQSLQRAFCYNGRYSVFRKRSHGNDASTLPTGRFVVCSQNHDQIGNRFLGERLISLTDTPRARLAAALVLLSPYLPLLFMGEEHGEAAPFLYFADHTDEPLRQGVRDGRKAEFAAFVPKGTPPDPFDHTTFETSKPDWHLQETPEGAAMLRLYKKLITLRREHPAIGPTARIDITVTRYPSTSVIGVHYRKEEHQALCLFNCSDQNVSITAALDGKWRTVINSETIDATTAADKSVPAFLPQLIPMPPFGFMVFEKVS